MDKSRFLTELDRRDLDDENSFLLSPLRYFSELLGGIIEVETGFVSDGSSTPRVPIVYDLYGDRSHREGFIHDRIYRAPNHVMNVEYPDGTVKLRTFAKSEADSIFKEAMIARGKPWYVVQGMFLGVKFGGLSSWLTGFQRFKIVDIKARPF